MPTMKSWGLPTDPVTVPIIGEIYFGDHTWVTSDDKLCWNVLGGGPGFYCGDQRWQGNDYIPPTITWRGRQVTGRELSSAPGEPEKATCMGGTATKFGEIPVYAGIIYGVHGVCHQMANRLLLTSGKTVALAEGFPLSAATYGIYGTTIPRFVWLAAMWVPPFAVALAGYVIGMNAAFATSCATCGVSYPGPILAGETQDDEQRLVAEVLDLHSVGKQIQQAPVTATAASIANAVAVNQEIHLRELDLLLEFRSRGRVGADKLDRVRQSYADYLRPELEAIAIVADAMRTPPEERDVTPAAESDIERFALEANRSAIAQQDELANILGIADFETLFGTHPDTKIGLVDPRILRGDPDVAIASA